MLTQGIQNATNGQNQLQTADGGMSSIGNLLDTARSLATEWASGTFTGDRTVLNTEFQSVLGEINRQAQAIGLNQGGSLATTLSVFIGGGEASNGVSAATNGSVGVNSPRRPWMPRALVLKACRLRAKREPTSATAAPPASRTFWPTPPIRHPSPITLPTSPSPVPDSRTPAATTPSLWPSI